MKNNQYKVIFTIFIMSLLIILALGLYFLVSFKGDNMQGAKVVIVAMTMLALASIALAIFTYRKNIKPMSKMLKSADPYNDLTYLPIESDNVDDMMQELRDKLIKANSQKRQTDTILKYMNDGIISFDMSGNVTYVNPAAVGMMELQDSDDTFTKIFSKYTDINMEKIIYLEDWTSSETKIENKQGYMNLFFVPFKDSINRPTGLMVVIQDITEHVRLDNMRKEFVADVSHELKTPLTSIKGFSETLLDGVDDEETRNHFLTIINDNADRMQKLVQDLLILSKYDNKQSSVKKTEFNLGELAKKCAEKFEIEVKKKKQKLECLVTSNVPDIKADLDGIERVIINIISNSVKYTPDGGKIDVYVGSVHNDVYIKIKDTGIGIPQSDIDKIFERFYRVDKARSRQMGGTGLGLSIAKEIIEQNNGNISITSELGKGTEVVIRLPIRKRRESTKG